MKFFKYLLVFVCFLAKNDGHGQLPPNFFDEIVSADWSRPVGLTFDLNGQGYVWDRSGLVYILEQDGTKLEVPLLDITEEVSDYWDLGMLGFALDPDFLENGHFYVFYTVDRHHLLFFGTPDYDPNAHWKNAATIGRITRFTADANQNFQKLIPNSRKVLVGETIDTGFPIIFKTHGVGSLAFGTDGTLLASCGETGWPEGRDIGSLGATYYEEALEDGIIKPKENVGAYRSQLIDCLAGKIIRIDPNTGDGLPSNPFFDSDDPRAPRSRVWSLGLRNPYRFIVKPNTGSHLPEDGNPGTLYVGDVGSTIWEEFLVISESGKNYGWPIWEGFDIQPKYEGWLVENLDAPNPLFDEEGCNQPYLYFTDLVKPDVLDQDFLFENPCENDSLISNIPLFYHERPNIVYSNKNENVEPLTEVGSYDMNGSAISINVEDPNSGVEANATDGISPLPGLFYQGNAFPDEYIGKYFHVDLDGWIKIFEINSEERIVKVEDFYQGAPGKIVTLEHNPNDGCLYYIDWENKHLRRICYGGIPAPVPTIEVDQKYGASPLTVQFKGENSSTATDFPLTYFWDFGDGTFSDEINPSHTFDSNTNLPSFFEPKLTVTDSSGQSKTTSEIISLNNTPPIAEITSIENGAKYPVDESHFVMLRAIATDLEHSEEELTYTWRTFLQHDEHNHPAVFSNKKEENMLISPLGCEEDNYWYRIELEVKDAAGLSTTQKIEIFPDCNESFFELEYFYGESINQGIELKWEAKEESGVELYEIQKSEDYLNFKTLGIIAAPIGNYQFLDENPLVGTNIYRLKIVGKEKEFDFSDIETVEYPIVSNINVFPNPAYNDLNVKIEKAKDRQVEIELYDSSGKSLIKKELKSGIGERVETNINIWQISNGVYYLSVQNGQERHLRKVMILR